MTKKYNQRKIGAEKFNGFKYLTGKYDTDLTDEQWSYIAPMLPLPKPGGRPRTTDLKRAVEAVLYLVRTGCQWRNLPADFPPWQTVYTYFEKWRRCGVIRKIHQALVESVRRKEHRKLVPAFAVLDSQSVKTGKMGGERGFDGGKRIKGRKRHVAVDPSGLILSVSVTKANTHDTKGARRVVRRLMGWMKDRAPRKFYADKGYTGENFAQYIRQTANAVVRIGENFTTRTKVFSPDKKRWRVERTFAWLGDYRRLDKDQERLIKNSVTMIRWAMIRLMLRRLYPVQMLIAA